ncbi:MAG TPA: class I SAM-dependent methyltransferase [Terriglobales bacterium]|nr:class I SAM-dependent methyltransferase [Terriglobales bacterium]
MPVQEEALNLRTYRVPEVASHYAALNYLTPCEQLLFRTYIKPGMAVLDLGVGGGRTTSYLSSVSSLYVGVDYSEAMIHACRKKFPDLDFLRADASDLSAFEDASFDAIVFSFNGLDCVVPDEKRLRCLRACWRVLRPTGVLVFSSHNPRSILVRTDWDRGRLRAFARRLVSHRSAFLPLVVGGLTVAKAIQAFIRAATGSTLKIARRVPSPAFWRGEGDVYDPVDGGLQLHYSIPDRVVAELAEFDFHLVKLMGDDYPRVSRPFLTDWYYYVFSKTDNYSIGGKSCA